MSDYQLRQASLADVLGLRTALLPDSPTLLGDDHPDTLHVTAVRKETIVGIGSVGPEPMPDGPQDSWRIAGVAVEHGHRGLGVGGLIVERCIDHLTRSGATHVWCRVPAGVFGFFERYGFRRIGDPSSGATGPEYVMSASVAPVRRSWSLEADGNR